MQTKDFPGIEPLGRAARRGRPAVRVAAVVLVTALLLGVIGSLAAGSGAQAGSAHGPLTAPQRWVLDRMPHTG